MRYKFKSLINWLVSIESVLRDTGQHTRRANVIAAAGSQEPKSKTQIFPRSRSLNSVLVVVSTPKFLTNAINYHSPKYIKHNDSFDRDLFGYKDQ